MRRSPSSLQDAFRCSLIGEYLLSLVCRPPWPVRRQHDSGQTDCPFNMKFGNIIEHDQAEDEFGDGHDRSTDRVT